LDAQLHHPSDSSAAADDRPRESLDVAVLTRRMLEGEDMAYRIFYTAYFDRIMRYLLVVAGGDEEAAREAVQATLVRVVRHIKVFADEAAFWRWLTVLARSAFTDETRKRRRYFAFLDRFTRHTDIQSGVADTSEADEHLRALLRRGLASLPADERQLLESKYLAARSVRDIAGELQTSEKAIESRLVRIRRKLKETVLAGLKNEPPA
jgi:RNA polymerase sigma-70 factor (ECF subfamily)